MTDSFVDPKTGDINGDGFESNQNTSNQNKSENFSVSRDDWMKLQAKLDIYEKQFVNPEYYRNQPQTPPEPQGPNFESQVAELETQIETLDDQIEQASEEGKSVKALLRKQRQLNTKLTRMTIEHDTIAPMRAQGMNALTYLTEEVTRSKMPHYELVKRDMDSFLSQLSADQRTDPKILEFAYNQAVGQPKNLNKILASEKEKALREASSNVSVPDASGNGRNKSKSKIPLPAKVLGLGAMAALKDKGITVDQHFQKRGYENWADYWEKKGKEHYSEYAENMEE